MQRVSLHKPDLTDLLLRGPLLLRLLLLRGGLLKLLLPLPLPRHRVHRLLRDVQQLHAARLRLPPRRVGPAEGYSIK